MEENDIQSEQNADRDKDGHFLPGHGVKSPGRPKGSVSIRDRIRQMLEDDPNEFENLCRYYMQDPKMRDLLWKMLEGMPKQATEHTGELNLPFTINIIKYEPDKLGEGKDGQAV